MNRRTFLGLAGAAANAQDQFALSTLPNFCSHEHWGSIDSIGAIPGGYRADHVQGAIPRGPTGLFDILIDPYFRGLLTGAGVERIRLARGTGWSWFTELKRTIAPYQLTGIYQCTRRGIQALYGADISSLEAGGLARLESTIDARYRQPFTWYRKAMAQSRFSELIRPVHPEFYLQKESTETAAAESAFTRTVMRIDPLLDLGTGPPERRKLMIELSGIEPADASSWRSFISFWFEQAARAGAAGIKQLQAYRRSLNFPTRDDGEIRWTDNATDETRKRQDWIVHECCRQANDRGWAHQIHVGTHNLAQSSPQPLQELARRYPRMKIVLIHCWPFLAESGWLARHTPNIYIDTCWQPILNPAYFRRAMSEWWNYVPIHKITCGHDATTVEMAAGSSLFTREILAGILREQHRQGVGAAELLLAAKAVLHDNAAAVYGSVRR